MTVLRPVRSALAIAAFAATSAVAWAQDNRSEPAKPDPMIVEPLGPVQTLAAELDAPILFDDPTRLSSSFSLESLEALASANRAQGGVTAPWYQSFTFRTPELFSNGVSLNTTAATNTDVLLAQRRFGLTLDFEGGGDQAALDFDGLRAGAFWNLTPRMRVGGQLRLTAPEDFIGSIDPERDEPEIKLESAFRF
ncbi:MAG: NtrZ family periplasmic regulatory protein [Maricaulaceae bacterium]